jgi:hypothetical protein
MIAAAPDRQLCARDSGRQAGCGGCFEARMNRFSGGAELRRPRLRRCNADARVGIGARRLIQRRQRRADTPLPFADPAKLAILWSKSGGTFTKSLVTHPSISGVARAA